MNINLESKVKGRYRLAAIGPDGKERRGSGWFDNLITNNGLDLMYTGQFLQVCAAGTSNTAPDVTDTQLGAQLGSTSSVSRTTGRQISTTPYYVFQVATFTFAQGDIVGNVAEIGVGFSDTSLYSRALVEDGGGSPTTITVLADEFLRVEYELRVQIPDADTTGTFDIGGTTYTWTARARRIDSDSFWDVSNFGQPFDVDIENSVQRTIAYDGSIGAITAGPSGSSDSRTSVSNAAYTSGDFAATADLVWGPNDGNFSGGIGAVVFGGEGGAYSYQIGFSPKLPKTNTDQLTLTVTHSWGRA